MTLTVTCQFTVDDFAADREPGVLRLLSEAAAVLLEEPRRFPRIARYDAEPFRVARREVEAGAEGLEMEPERWDGLS